MIQVKIIQDTKEQLPWNFLFYNECKAQICKHLETGDYSAEGYEDKIVIERKHSTGELAINLGAKYEQFHAEFERMRDIPYRYIICEFTREDILAFPARSGIPRTKWAKLRMNGKFMLKRLLELCEEFEVELFFANGKEQAEEIALGLIINAVKKIDSI